MSIARPKVVADEAILLLIDHQDGTLNFVQNVPRAGVEVNARALARMASVLDIPTVLTSSQEDQAQGPLMPALQQILPDAFERRVRRGGIANAWEDPDFRAAVIDAAGDRKQVILAGVTNDVCTVAPAISLVDDGFTVMVVQDAGGSMHATAEDVARRDWERAGAHTVTTAALIAEVARDWSTPTGGNLAQITFEEIVANLDAFVVTR